MIPIPSLRFIAVSVVALVATTITALSLNTPEPTAVAMRLSPTSANVGVGNTVQVAVIVESPVAVNAFTGEVTFNSDNFSVVAIDYNTSLANLWVEEPWYNRADNSVYFAGGTTAPGGFTGRDQLLTITLRATAPGATDIALNDARILLHDGLGTDAALAPQIESVFTASTNTEFQYTPAQPEVVAVAVREDLPSPDLNDDGVVSFLDIGLLLTRLGSTNERYDLNGDGVVSTKDFAVIQDAR